MFTDGRTDRQRTDARLIAISPELIGRGIKMSGNSMMSAPTVAMKQTRKFNVRSVDSVCMLGKSLSLHTCLKSPAISVYGI